MWKRFLNWLDQAQVSDPLQRSQLRMTQGLFLLVLSTDLLTIPLILRTRERIILVPALSGSVLGAICFIVALILIRRGYFTCGVTVGVSGLIIQITMSAIPAGVLHSPGPLLAYLVPITLAGLLANRRTLVIMTVVISVIAISIAYLELLPIPITGYAASISARFSHVVWFTIIAGVISSAVGFFRGTLERVLRVSFDRQNELEVLRGSLEGTVAERTASLEHALTALQSALIEVEQREAHLTQTLADLQASRETIREMSAPIIPVLAGVLVTPLIGAIDTQRATDFTQNLLTEIERQHTAHVILDVTGMLVIDTQVAQLLLQTATAVRLLGAQALLAGVRPEVAQTIVSLGADLHAIPTFSDLRSAVESLVHARLPTARVNGARLVA